LKKKVLWVTRRGFRYAEKSFSDGRRVMIVKAIVIVH
jgi:hypothetical protein